jgi:hypothetical protein
MIARVLHRLVAWMNGEDVVSYGWLRDRDRLEQRVEFHGPAWRWPANKKSDRAGEWNRHRLRRRA